MKFYSDTEIESTYKMKDAISDIQQVLNDLNASKIINKERTVIEMEDTKNTMLFMPCVNLNSEYSILKTISIFPDNTDHPVSQGVTLLSELKHGEHIATLDSSYLTRLRTGAMSAIATDALSSETSKVLAVIGTGGMAFEQVLGILEVRPIETIKLYNRSLDKAERFKQKLQSYGIKINIEVVSDMTEAVKDADIINCATRSEEAVFNYKDVKQNVHINGVGSYLPEMREIDIPAIEQAKVIVIDDIEGATHEAGEFIQAEKENKFSFEQAIPLNKLQDQYDRDQLTIFKSVGAAYYDLAVTVGAYKKLK